MSNHDHSNQGENGDSPRTSLKVGICAVMIGLLSLERANDEQEVVEEVKGKKSGDEIRFGRKLPKLGRHRVSTKVPTFDVPVNHLVVLKTPYNSRITWGSLILHDTPEGNYR